MASNRIFSITNVAVGIAAFVHSLFAWPVNATLAVFGGGALVVFVAEAVIIKLGWLEHHIDPQLFDVPLYLIFGWLGTIYIAYQTALFVTDGWIAVVVGASLATVYDLLTDHRGVSNGHWTYTDSLPGPRYRGVPWWNFVGWFVLSVVTAGFAVYLL